MKKFATKIHEEKGYSERKLPNAPNVRIFYESPSSRGKETLNWELLS